MKREEYKERTIKIMQQLGVEELKQVYTVAATLLDISQEEHEKKGGKA